MTARTHYPDIDAFDCGRGAMEPSVPFQIDCEPVDPELEALRQKKIDEIRASLDQVRRFELTIADVVAEDDDETDEPIADDGEDGAMYHQAFAKAEERVAAKRAATCPECGEFLRHKTPASRECVAHALREEAILSSQGSLNEQESRSLAEVRAFLAKKDAA